MNKKKVAINIISIILIIASAVFVCIGGFACVWKNAAGEYDAKLYHFIDAIFYSPSLGGIVTLIFVLNLILCLTSMISKRKKDPVLHTIFPVGSLIALIFLINNIPLEDWFPGYYDHHDYFSADFSQYSHVGQLSLLMNRNEHLQDYLVISFCIFFVYIIFCFVKRSSVIVGKKQKTKKEQPTNPNELENLKSLLDKGIITQEEFDAKKKQILGL